MPIELDTHSTDDAIDAAIAENPNLHVDAFTEAEAVFARALSLAGRTPFPPLAQWVPLNTLHAARGRHVAPIEQAQRMLNYVPRPTDEALAVIKRDIVRRAIAMRDTFAPACGPTTITSAMEKLHAAEFPGHPNPYRPAPVFDATAWTPRLHGAKVLANLRERGISVTLVDDKLELIGPFHDADRANVAQVRSEIIDLLRQQRAVI
jgi:hypothetical protein